MARTIPVTIGMKMRFRLRVSSRSDRKALEKLARASKAIKALTDAKGIHGDGSHMHDVADAMLTLAQVARRMLAVGGKRKDR